MIIGTHHYGDKKKGKDRDGISILETEKMLRSFLYNNKDERNSGFFQSTLIGTSQIDYYFAFMPLEKNHVKQCIISESVESGVIDIDDCVEKVLERIEFIPTISMHFSATGCKKIFMFVSAFCH
ncbi:hypothetical protein MXB_1844 [Myxobolus squamalis]|nr:hypothetical protein MXB_1844 [Myxobolus squamalis]